MTTKEYLLQAFTLDRLLKARQSQIAELRSMAAGVGAIITSDKVQSSPKPDHMGDTVARLVDLIGEFERDIIRLIELKHEIRAMIERVDNPTHRLILEERYLNLKRWEDIAADNNYSWKGVHKIHGKALEAVKEYIEVHTIDMIQ